MIDFAAVDTNNNEVIFFEFLKQFLFYDVKNNMFYMKQGILKCQLVNDDEKDKINRLEEKISEMKQSDFYFNKSDLVAIKAFRVPPEAVNMVSEAMLENILLYTYRS